MSVSELKMTYRESNACLLASRPCSAGRRSGFTEHSLLRGN